MKEKVVFVYPSLSARGGSERTQLEILKRLSYKYDFKVYTPIYKPELTYEEFSNFNVHILPANRWLRGNLNIFYWMQLRIPEDYDLLILYTGTEGVAVNNKGPVLFKCDTPERRAHDLQKWYLSQCNLISKAWFYLTLPFYHLAEGIAWKKAVKVMANSNNVKQRIVDFHLAKVGDVDVVFPGVDLTRFRPTGRSDNYFLHVGRITPIKRADLAIAAMTTLNRRLPNHGFKLIISGFIGNDTASQDYLKHLKNIAPSNTQFVLNPKDEEIINLYNNCNSLLFCAIDEDFGITPIEAMACGKPVISVDEGGPKESVIDGRTGFLVNSTPEAFYTKMRYIIENPETVSKMAQDCRIQAERFSWDIFIKSLDRLIMQIISSNH
jgi:glycosyltransferase involved in cell wall biosynthesis